MRSGGGGGAEEKEPKRVHSYCLLKDPMLPLGVFWELFRGDLADEWMDLGKEIFLTLGYDDKTTKDKINFIKYSYAVQGDYFYGYVRNCRAK